MRPGLLSSFSTVKVLVGQSGVVAAIAGGAAQAATSSSTIVIDASQSYDVDYPTDPSALSFAWSCIVSAPTYGDGCGQIQVQIVKSSIVTLKPGALAPLKTYLFTVTVSKNGGAFSSTASVLLTVVANAIPVLTMQPTSAKYNPGDKITITASIQGVNQSVAFWSSSNMTAAALAAISLTSIKVTALAGSTPFQLAIAPNSLTMGLTFNFQLNCVYVGTTTPAFASVSIVINQPPSSGSFVVSPAQGGSALNTSYFYTAPNWVDADLPLSYTLGYYVSASAALSVVQMSAPQSYVRALMGPGLQSNRYQVNCTAIVSDYYGCPAYAFFTVDVAPPSQAALQNAVSSGLSTAFKSNDISAVSQLITAVTSSINVVSCNPLPRTCKLLNRMECSQTFRTVSRANLCQSFF